MEAAARRSGGTVTANRVSMQKIKTIKRLYRKVGYHVGEGDMKVLLDAIEYRDEAIRNALEAYTRYLEDDNIDALRDALEPLVQVIKE